MKVRITLLALALCACAGDENDSLQAGSDVDGAVYEGCGSTPAFALGTVERGMSGQIEAVLLDAMPKPPMRYRNDWTVQFRNADTHRVLPDADITMVRPFMPVHGHDGNVLPTVSRGADDSFRIENLNLNMRGPWEIRDPRDLAVALARRLCAGGRRLCVARDRLHRVSCLHLGIARCTCCA
ncbi:MAG: hypothetical protein QM778_25330 [Myxococcales bacterium]